MSYIRPVRWKIWKTDLSSDLVVLWCDFWFAEAARRSAARPGACGEEA